MKLFCQITISVLFLLRFFVLTYQDFNGREEREPTGMAGFIGSFVAMVLSALLLYGAGLFQ